MNKAKKKYKAPAETSRYYRRLFTFFAALVMVVCMITFLIIYLYVQGLMKKWDAVDDVPWSGAAFYSRDGAWIVTTSGTSYEYKTVSSAIIWDSQTENQIALLGKSYSTTMAWLSPNNDWIMIQDGYIGVTVYSTGDWQRLYSLSLNLLPICELTITGDITYLVLCNSIKNEVYVAKTSSLMTTHWEKETIEEIEAIPGQQNVFVTENPSKTKLFIAFSSKDGSYIEVRDSSSYDIQGVIRTDFLITNIDWIANDQILMSSNDKLYLWEVETFEQTNSIELSHVISSFDVSVNRKLLAVGGGTSITLFDLANMSIINTIEVDSVLTIQFNSTGTIILASTADEDNPYIEVEVSSILNNTD